MYQRQILDFNTDWLFIDQDIVEAGNPGIDEAVFQQVCLPHANKLVPHHYFAAREYQFISWYRKHFYLEEGFTGKRVIIEFGGIMSAAEIYVNRDYAGSHLGGYTSFALDITELVEIGRENLLAVRVDSRSRQDIPPEGGLVDYLLFGGIYREARLLLVDSIYIEDAFFRVIDLRADRALIRLEIELKNHLQGGEEAERLLLKAALLDQEGKTVIKREQSITAAGEGEKYVFPELELPQPSLWSPAEPVLYRGEVSLYRSGKLSDRYAARIGIRQAAFGEDGRFYLNGKPLKLRGLNRHQNFPFLGGAMPARGQRKDAEILKYELGLNFVRSSHYPAHPAFLERCDEIGLLVMEELPGWQHIGDQAWKETAVNNLREMIIRDRNHPSIFLWGVRINESEDDHSFYLETNRTARSLDPGRPTGGVRCNYESEFLEDVFTYNDFAGNLQGEIKDPPHLPYMITEYMGHMYPTKAADSVERLLKHALYHAGIQDRVYGNPEIAGASGWCAFDYNTHPDFGSGNGVCYHGVCDIYRLPKFAAYFYRSQQDPTTEPVVFIARYLIPSFNEDFGDELVVFSNCQEVDLFVSGKLVNTAVPDRERFRHLPHPPFIFTGCRWWDWGGRTVGSLRAVGRIGGRIIKEHEIFPFGPPEKLSLQPDYTEINADGADCTRVVVTLRDGREQILHLANHPVFFEISGPGGLIGENPLALEAGKGAVFIRAGRQPGRVVLKAWVRGGPAGETSLLISDRE